MAVLNKEASPFKRAGSGSYRDPNAARTAKQSDLYGKRFGSMQHHDVAAAANAAAAKTKAMQPQEKGFLDHNVISDSAYIMDAGGSDAQDAGDMSADAVRRAANVAKDRAIDHFVGKLDLDSYDLSRPLDIEPPADTPRAYHPAQRSSASAPRSQSATAPYGRHGNATTAPQRQGSAIGMQRGGYATSAATGAQTSFHRAPETPTRRGTNLAVDSAAASSRAPYRTAGTQNLHGMSGTQPASVAASTGAYAADYRIHRGQLSSVHRTGAGPATNYYSHGYRIQRGPAMYTGSAPATFRPHAAQTSFHRTPEVPLRGSGMDGAAANPYAASTQAYRPSAPAALHRSGAESMAGAAGAGTAVQQSGIREVPANRPGQNAYQPMRGTQAPVRATRATSVAAANPYTLDGSYRNISRPHAARTKQAGLQPASAADMPHAPSTAVMPSAAAMPAVAAAAVAGAAQPAAGKGIRHLQRGGGLHEVSARGKARAIETASGSAAAPAARSTLQRNLKAPTRKVPTLHQAAAGTHNVPVYRIQPGKRPTASLTHRSPSLHSYARAGQVHRSLHRATGIYHVQKGRAAAAGTRRPARMLKAGEGLARTRKAIAAKATSGSTMPKVIYRPVRKLVRGQGRLRRPKTTLHNATRAVTGTKGVRARATLHRRRPGAARRNVRKGPKPAANRVYRTASGKRIRRIPKKSKAAAAAAKAAGAKHPRLAKVAKVYRAYNRLSYAKSIITPGDEQDMGDAVAHVPADALNAAGHAAARKGLRSLRSAYKASKATAAAEGASPMLRRVNVRRARAAAAKASEAAAPQVRQVRSLGDIVHNFIATLKSVPSRIAADIKMLLAGGLASAVPVSQLFGLIAIALLPLMFVVLLVSIIIPSMASVGTLSGDAAQLATFLKNDMGLNDAQTAAVVANAVFESGDGAWVPGHDVVISWSAVNSSSGATGIFQWLGGRKVALQAIADSQGKQITDSSVQLEYLKSSWNSSWIGVSCSPMTDGRYTQISSLETFMNETDPAAAAVEFLVGYERPGKSEAKVDARVACAQAVYTALTSSGGGTVNDGTLSGSQQAVINAAHGGSYGTGYYQCAAWVSRVMGASGIGSLGGNANDMYDRWCRSSNKDDLKPGMIIAVSTSKWSPVYGHVGIYVGNGTVMDQVGYIRTKDLDAWIQEEQTTVPVRWGWYGNIPLA